MKTRTLPVGKLLKYQQGFTYIVVLAALIVVGILAEVLSQSVSIRIKRDKELELLHRGMAYQKAIKSYVNSHKQNKLFPRHLDDLVSDPRFINKKHIRQAYADPITGGDWLLIKNKFGGITGVASSSKQKPLKQKYFPLGMESFEDAEHYSDWIFEYRP